MNNTQKILIGVLTILILSSAVVITFQDNLRIEVERDKTQFKVPREDIPWFWKVAGEERNYIYDGRSQMHRDLSSIEIEKEINNETQEVWITRKTEYQREPVIKDIYYFRGDVKDKELFPISHKVRILNASGYFYRYVVDELDDTGEMRSFEDQTEFSFGNNMKVEIDPGYRWAWIGYLYGSDSFSAQYDIESDNETFNVRLFDPDSYDLKITSPYEGEIKDSVNFEFNWTVNGTLEWNTSITSASYSLNNEEQTEIPFGYNNDFHSIFSDYATVGSLEVTEDYIFVAGGRGNYKHNKFNGSEYENWVGRNNVIKKDNRLFTGSDSDDMHITYLNGTQICSNKWGKYDYSMNPLGAGNDYVWYVNSYEGRGMFTYNCGGPLQTYSDISYFDGYFVYNGTGAAFNYNTSDVWFNQTFIDSSYSGNINTWYSKDNILFIGFDSHTTAYNVTNNFNILNESMPSSNGINSYKDRLTIVNGSECVYEYNITNFNKIRESCKTGSGESYGAVASDGLATYAADTGTDYVDIFRYKNLDLFYPNKGNHNITLYNNLSDGSTHQETNNFIIKTLIPELIQPSDGSGYITNHIYTELNPNENFYGDIGDIWFKVNETTNISRNIVSEGEPIYSCDDLKNIANNVNGEYYLGGDIDCSDYSFTPISYENGSSFKGKLHGNFFTIKNLEANAGGMSYGGIFGELENSRISNISIINSEANGIGYGGWSSIFAGYSINNNTIKNIYLRNITIRTDGNPNDHGRGSAFIGNDNGGNIYENIFVENVQHNQGFNCDFGAIFWSLGDSYIENSYTFGSATGGGLTAGFTRALDSSAIINNSFVAMSGFSNIFYNGDSGTSWNKNCFYDVNRTSGATLNNHNTAEMTAVNQNGEEMDYWYNDSKPIYNSWDFENLVFADKDIPKFQENHLKLQDGLYNITLFINSSSGVVDSDTSEDVTIFTEDLNLTIFSPIDNGNYSTEEIFLNFSIDNPSGNIWFYDGTENISYTEPTYYNFSNGNNNIIVYANDSVGHFEKEEISFTIDSTPPTAEYISPTPENNSVMSYDETTINISVSEDASEVDTAILEWKEPTIMDKFNDSKTTDNITFYEDNRNVTKYMSLPINATIGSTTMDLTGRYRANMSNETFYERYGLGSSDYSVRGSIWVSQTFTVGDTSTNEINIPTSISLKGYRVGNPGNLTIILKELNATGYPTGDEIISGVYNASKLTTDSSGELFNINFSSHEYLLQKDTTYSIIVKVPDGDASNYVSLKYDASGTYEGGTLFETFNSGGSWSESTSADVIFKQFGTEKVFPEGNWLEIGGYDLTKEWEYSSPLQSTVTIDNFDEDLNYSLLNCQCTGCTVDGDYCNVPFTFHSDTVGKFEYDNIEVKYIWKFGTQNYTMDCYEITTIEEDSEGFESGSFDSDWEKTTNFNIETDYVHTGSYSGAQRSGNTPDAIFAPSIISGGEEVNEISFYWLESMSQSGFTVEFVNSNGNNEFLAGGNNPQWELKDGDGSITPYDGDGYQRWILYNFTFDWDNDEYSYYMEDMSSGHTETGTRSLMNGEDIEKIKINANEWGNAEYIWVDDFFIESSSSNKYCSYTIYNSTFGLDYTFRTIVNNTFGGVTKTPRRTLVDDTLAPSFSNPLESPTNNSEYKTGLYQFNITLTEHNLRDYYINWEGTNYEPIEIDYTYPNYTLSFNRTSLDPGKYTYYWWANDTAERTGTLEREYYVRKAESDVRTYLNGTRGNFSVDEDTPVNLTSVLVSGDDNISMFVDGGLFNSGESPLTNITTFQPGLYNITSIFEETYYYTSDKETWFLEVNDTTKPNLSIINPNEGDVLNIYEQNFTFNVSDNYNLKNVSIEIYNDTDKIYSNSTEFNDTKSEFIKYYYELPGEGNYTWNVEVYDTSGNKENESVSFDIENYPIIELNSPESGSYYIRLKKEGFNVTLNATFYDRTPDIMNVTFYDNSTGEVLCNNDSISNGTTMTCVWDKEFQNQVPEYWKISASDGKRTAWSDVFNFTIKDVKIQDVHVEPNPTNVTVKWRNDPEIEWTSLYLFDENWYPVDNVFLTSSGTWDTYTFKNLNPNTEYHLEWQTGYSYYESAFYNMSFRTKGWHPSLDDWTYKRKITIDHEQVQNDSENTILNLSLTDDNFQECTMMGCSSDFPLMNYTNGIDLRFTDIRDIDVLDYNITYWNITGDGGSQTQYIPDEESYNGNYDNNSYCHDADYNTRCIPNPGTVGVQYFNYTIPEGAETDSGMYAYIGDWYYEYPPLPSGCFAGEKLQFRSKQDYDNSNSTLSCWNGTAWDTFFTAASSYFYDTQMNWRFNSEAHILVETTHFQDFYQNHTSGVDGDYDVELWMYYGNPSAPNNQSDLSQYDNFTDAYTLGGRETYSAPLPEISNVSESKINNTRINISWKVSQTTDNRIKLANNEWYVEDYYTSRVANETEEFNDLAGTSDHTRELKTHKEDFMGIVDVTCSNNSYSDNYTINASKKYPEITFLSVDDSSDLDWTVKYTSNNSWDVKNSNPYFILDNLDPNMTYYYNLNSIGVGGTASYKGDFILGTPYDTPQSEIYDYDEDRPNSEVTIFGNLTDMNNNEEVKVQIQYWHESSEEFNYTSNITLNSTETFNFTIPVEYGHDYSYRIVSYGNHTGYSEERTERFMALQPFFAGNYLKDDEDERSRQYCPNLSEGYVNCTEQTGVLEGSTQEEDWLWIETNITEYGNLTVHWYNGSSWSEHNMSKSGDMNYIKMENLDSSWQTFYITNYSDYVVLNWTKPGIKRALTGYRTDNQKMVSFNNTPKPLNDSGNYTVLYMDKVPEFNTSTAYCENNGGDLFTCMSTSVWGTPDYLPSSMVGTDYDRGRLFSGGVTDGGTKDTGSFSEEPVDYEFKDPTGSGWGTGAQTGRGCFAFTIYYWNNMSWKPSNNITNFYYRYWRQDQAWSEYYGVVQDYRFDYACIKRYNDTMENWNSWEGQEEYVSRGSTSCHEGTLVKNEITAETVPNSTFNSSYNQSLTVGYKKGFNIDTSGSNIYNIVPYFDGKWVNQLFNKYQQAFVAFNLPDNETLKSMDSDNDGLNDYEELFVYYTNPENNDTDGGGVDDGTEINIAGTNPNIYADEEVGAPVISNITWEPENESSYLPETVYYFRANVTDDSDVNVTFQIDNTNYSAYNIYGDIWEANVTGLSVGFHNFSWYAEDIFGHDSWSDVYRYYVAEANKYDFNVSLSPGINTLEFRPDNSTHQALEPTNQTESKGIIIAHNNWTFDGRLVIKLDNVYDTQYGDITLKSNDVYNYSNAVTVTNEYKSLSGNLNNLPQNNQTYIWLWADYDVATKEWEPNLRIKIQEL